MIDFDRKPQKSKEEREFDALDAKYMEMFGESYEFFIGFDSGTWEETLADIRRCIDTGEPRKKPEYNGKMIY